MRRLKKDDAGYDVARWQAFLASQGLLPSMASADGDFGQKTHDATVAFQRQAGLEDDGIAGPMTKAAAEALGFSAPRGPDDFSSEVLGPNSRDRLCTLQPDLADFVIELVREAKNRHGIISALPITAGLRTFAKQAELFAQGRTKPGNIVTNAGPGESYHNYGVAVDIHTLRNDTINFNDVFEAEQRGPIGRNLGLEWGGDWQGFKDRPHFQLPKGLRTRDCLELYNQGGIIAVSDEISRRVEARDVFPPGDEVE